MKNTLAIAVRQKKATMNPPPLAAEKKQTIEMAIRVHASTRDPGVVMEGSMFAAQLKQTQTDVM